MWRSRRPRSKRPAAIRLKAISTTQPAARGAAAMRGGVDATREPRGDDETFEPEFACKLAREFLSRRGAVARADDGDDGKGGELNAALDVEKRRRRIDMGERR